MHSGKKEISSWSLSLCSTRTSFAQGFHSFKSSGVRLDVLGQPSRRSFLATRWWTIALVAGRRERQEGRPVGRYAFFFCPVIPLVILPPRGNRQLVLDRRSRSEDNEKQPDRFGEQSHTPRVSQESGRGHGVSERWPL